MQLTAERLRDVLNYDPDMGLFKWKLSSGTKRSGMIAGSQHKNYLNIQIDSAVYKAHRLAWLYQYGVWPSLWLDHKNGIGTDNRIDNLREVDHSKNMQNQRAPHKNNACGFLGVHAQGDKFRARIRHGGRNLSLGLHDTPQQAHTAYVDAKRKYHEGCTL